MEAIIEKYSDVFDETIGTFEEELHLVTRYTTYKAAPREIPHYVKNNVFNIVELSKNKEYWKK